MLKKLKLLKGKRSNITLYITFFIVAIIIITITALFAPMGVLVNTKFYAAGEDILLSVNESIADINDPTVRNSIYSMLDDSFAAQENNIEVNNALFQYSWVVMLIVTFLIIFLASRAIVERQGGGFI